MRRGKHWLQTAGVLVGLLVWAAGCQENQSPDVRQARLLAAENIQLKKELNRCQARLEALKAEYDRQLERKETQLAATRKLSEDLQDDLRQGIAERVKAVTTRVMDENARLRQEIEALRIEIAELKAQQ